MNFTPHPITDRAFWENVRQDPRHAAFWARMDELAEAIPDAPPVVLATDYLAAQRRNDRSILDQFWWKSRSYTAILALRRLHLGLDENDPDDRLLNALWAILNVISWVPSAHLPGDLPRPDAPQLDLAACETAAMLGEFVETLGPWMHNVSPSLFQTTIAEIDRRVLTPYGDGVHVWWQDEPDRIMNWVGVCAGCILTACLALERIGQPRPLAKKRALEGLRLFAQGAFTAHGECDEGLSYWQYGLTNAILGWSRLSPEELAKNVDLARLAQVADYPRRAHLWGDFYYSGNDASSRFRPDFLTASWLSSATQNAFLSGFVPDQTPPPGADLKTGGKYGFGASLRAIEAHEWPRPAPPRELVAPAQRLEDQQVAIFRLPTPRGTLLATLGGGDNAERHNHNDLGHVNLALDEGWVLVDLGAPQGYPANFFGAKRYEYLLASSRGHACPLVNGYEQRAGHDAAQVVFWDDSRLELELHAAYPSEAGLKKWTRALEKNGDGFVLRDEFLAQPGAQITHVFWSLFAPEMVETEFILGPIRAQISPTPLRSSVQIESPENLNLRDWRGQTLHGWKLDFEADDDGVLKVEMTFGGK